MCKVIFLLDVKLHTHTTYNTQSSKQACTSVASCTKCNCHCFKFMVTESYQSTAHILYNVAITLSEKKKHKKTLAKNKTEKISIITLSEKELTLWRQHWKDPFFPFFVQPWWVTAKCTVAGRAAGTEHAVIRLIGLKADKSGDPDILLASQG